MSKQSSSNERKVQGYLKPKNYTIFKAYVTVEELTDSEGVNVVMNEFFNKMSPEQKQSYLSRSRRLSDFK